MLLGANVLLAYKAASTAALGFTSSLYDMHISNISTVAQRKFVCYTKMVVSACGKDICGKLVSWQHFGVLMQVGEAEAGQQRAIQALLDQLTPDNFDITVAGIIALGSKIADHESVSALVDQVSNTPLLPLPRLTPPCCMSRAKAS